MNLNLKKTETSDAETLGHMFTSIMIDIANGVEELDLGKANDIKKKCFEYLKRYIEELISQKFNELFNEHVQERYGEGGEGSNDWKWYNNGYYDCFQDMKISVEKKFGITINKLK